MQRQKFPVCSLTTVCVVSLANKEMCMSSSILTWEFLCNLNHYTHEHQTGLTKFYTIQCSYSFLVLQRIHVLVLYQIHISVMHIILSHHSLIDEMHFVSLVLVFPSASYIPLYE